MPRKTRRARGREVVIPTNSLVASSARYPGKANQRIYIPAQDWQNEAYRHYGICGEARYAANFFGHSVSRAVLGTAHKEGVTVVPDVEGRAYELLQELFAGQDGQTQMLHSLGVHLTIAGECYLVGRQVEGVGDVWEIVSVLEMKVVGDTWSINYFDGLPPVMLTAEDVVIRIWTPSPARRIEADSPFRSLLPILAEIEWLTRHVFAQITSRLASAGLLFVNQDVDFPPPPEREGVTIPDSTASRFLAMLAEMMLSPIDDPSNVAAVVPGVVMVPGDQVENAAKLVTFWSELDSEAKALRDEAIRRFALGMDLPPEAVLGMGSNGGSGGGTSNGVSHWGAWQIEESTIKLHVEPMLDVIVNALTIGYLRPALDDFAPFVMYDTAKLRLRPDRSKQAAEAYDRGELSGLAYRRETGFGEDDKPSEQELQFWLKKKVASGSTTPEMVEAALRDLGVQLAVAAPEEPSAPTPTEERPAPVPDRPPHPTPDTRRGCVPAARRLRAAGVQGVGEGREQTPSVWYPASRRPLVRDPPTRSGQRVCGAGDGRRLVVRPPDPQRRRGRAGRRDPQAELVLHRPDPAPAAPHQGVAGEVVGGRVRYASIEAFAAKRRDDQERLEAALLSIVRAALDQRPAENWAAPIEAFLAIRYRLAYHAEGGRGSPSGVQAFLADIDKALDKSTDSTRAETVATWLSTAVLNAATMEATADDEEFLVMEWVTMHDDDVRAAHKHTEGQQRPPGEPFDVDGVEMPYPGYPGVPIELWVNCRCSLAPALPNEFAAVTASDTPDLGICVVAVVDPDDGTQGLYGPSNETGPDGELQLQDPHLTLLWFGKPADNPGLDIDAVSAAVKEVSRGIDPFAAQVDQVDELGDDGALVWLLQKDGPTAVREALMAVDVLREGVEAVEQFPDYTPHVTIGYDMMLSGDGVEALSSVAEIKFDRLALWVNGDHHEYGLNGYGGTDDPANEEDTMSDETQPMMPTPFHAVLAPEGKWSGDGRQFAPGSLTHRDLPLPLTWQKTALPGHDGSVVVSKAEAIARVDGEIRATGYFLSNAEADEVIGLVAEFGRFGISVDADDAEFDFDETSGKVSFTRARIASASIVTIPAFAEAWIALGEAPPGFMGDDAEAGDVCDPNDPAYDADTCSAKDEAVTDAVAAMVATMRTRYAATLEMGRGPGWITNPEDTKRLHDYWTKPGEEGFVKVAWGTPGDFNRCRLMVGEEIAENSPDKVRFLNQICAQWHHDATGFWPGDAPAERAGAETLTPEGDPAPALHLVASSGWCAPSDWFKNPELSELTPLTITEDGRVFGHIAGWKTCHVAYRTCVAPPHSVTSYARFLTGYVQTTDGPVPTGPITYGTGHYKPGDMRSALAHYDNTGTVGADVACGDDDHGIWVAGWMRPGAPEEAAHILRGSAPSGDWRRDRAYDHLAADGRAMELCAVLSVNSQGYPVPRVGVQNGEQVSLVAAGVVASPDREADPVFDELVAAVADELSARRSRKQQMAAIAAKIGD